MVANVHVATSETSESVGLATDNETLDQILSLVIDSSSGREGVLDLHDALEETDLVGSVRVERRAADQHLVDQDTKGPVVDSLVVTLGENDLGCKILGSTAQRVGLVHDNLGETQVDKNTVTLFVNENVLGLQITVADASVMKMAQRLENAGSVEARVGVGDTVTCLRVNDGEKLSSLDELNQHVQTAIVLEGGHEIHDEGVVDRRHDVLLADDSFHLVMADDFSLVEHLQSVRRPRLLVAYKPNLSKGSDTENAELDEVLELYGFVHLGT